MEYWLWAQLNFKKENLIFEKVNCLKTPKERLFELKTNLTEICESKIELK